MLIVNNEIPSLTFKHFIVPYLHKYLSEHTDASGPPIAAIAGGVAAAVVIIVLVVVLIVCMCKRRNNSNTQKSGNSK